jgi:ADP-ribose pyrophosphatase YjhB (NUDIX family)
MRLVALGDAVRDVGSILVRYARGLLGGKPSRGGVAIVVDEFGRVLLVKARYRRTWSTPGGFFEDDEDTLDGALRELREEAGLEGDGRVTAMLRRRGHDEHVVLIEHYRGTPTAASWEISAIEWHRPNDDRRLHSITKAVLSEEGAAVRVDVDGNRYVPISLPSDT